MLAREFSETAVRDVVGGGVLAGMGQRGARNELEREGSRLMFSMLALFTHFRVKRVAQSTGEGLRLAGAFTKRKVNIRHRHTK